MPVAGGGQIRSSSIGSRRPRSNGTFLFKVMSQHGRATACAHKYNRCTVILMAASLKRLICRVLIGVLLSAQFAVAAYACPEISSAQLQTDVLALAGLTDGSSGHESQATASPVGLGKEHGRMDPTLPNLCDEHCRSGEQKAEQPVAPSVPSAVLSALYPLPDPEGIPALQVGFATSAAAMPAAPADPPHAILHCCLRD